MPRKWNHKIQQKFDLLVSKFYETEGVVTHAHTPYRVIPNIQSFTTCPTAFYVVAFLSRSVLKQSSKNVLNRFKAFSRKENISK